VALPLATLLVFAAAIASTAAAAARSAVGAMPRGGVPPLPLPRPPPESIDVIACAAAYATTGDAATYLCCVDPSLGYCAGVGFEHTRSGEVCTVDWTPARGTKCCFRAADGRTEPPLPGGNFGAHPPPPALAVTCRRHGSCTAAATAGPPPGHAEPRPDGPQTRASAAAAAGAQGEIKVSTCSSWDLAVYSKCEVTLCDPSPDHLSARRSRIVVRLTACELWGTRAQCCMELPTWESRFACCRKCNVPGRRQSSMGCCYAGKRPEEPKKTTPPPKKPNNKAGNVKPGNKKQNSAKNTKKPNNPKKKSTKKKQTKK